VERVKASPRQWTSLPKTLNMLGNPDGL